MREKFKINKINTKKFSDNVKEVFGLGKPLIVKSNPKKQMFYGSSMNKAIPKTKEDFVERLKYLNNSNDMIEIFIECKSIYGGEEIGKFLEKFNALFNNELKILINKHKEQQFIITKESEIKSEFEEKLNSFLSELDIIVKEKNFNLRETVNVYFEVCFRMKKDIPKEISDMIFESSKNSENLKDFKKMDLIKLSFILSRYKILLNKRQNAVEGLSNIVIEILKIGLGNFTKEELLSLMKNLSYKNVNTDLEFFTRLEPYLLKYMTDYNISSVVNIFCVYIKNFLGSNFFLQTIGLSIFTNLKFLTTKDLVFLLDTSNKKYYNREELNFGFIELFRNVFDFITPKINELKTNDIQIILRAMLNVSYNDKKLLHLLSTVYLKYSEKEEFKCFVNMVYYFLVLDLDNDIFFAKTLESFKFNLLCLKNYIMGNDSMDNLVGLYDKNLINYFPNISNIKDKIRFFERIQLDTEEIFSVLDILIKTVWNVSFILFKLISKNTANSDQKIKIENFSDLVKDTIEIFNIFVSNLLSSAENETEVKIVNANLKKLLQSYIYLSNISLKLKTKQNLNLEFLKGKNLNFQDHNFDYKDLNRYNNFRKSVLNVILSQSESQSSDLKFYETLTGKFVREISNSESEFTSEYFEQISNFELADFLQGYLKRTNNTKDKIKHEILFINDTYDYFEQTMNESGYNKFRKHLCNIFKLDPIYIDYNEFLIFFKDIQITDDNLEELISEFLVFKLK